MPNRLADETSPHLRQHAGNPIDWYPWGEEAWKRAVAEDKPVFLSIGYASCHWCHVMERESFSDPAVAALLNRDFISIKVDREERPDLDGLYIEALQTLMGWGGWPMSLFLTPGRKLFFGGTYFPPRPAGDLPSLSQVIESVTEEWHHSRSDLEAQAESVLHKMRDRSAMLPERQALSRELLELGIVGILSAGDQTNGGFGEAPKFPQPWLAEMMLRAAVQGPGGAHGLADLTLRRMARGGIYDQVGGGFHRHTVDPGWAIPDFEKMLYDNALLARLYTHAWQSRHDPLFRRIALETLEYLLAELRAPGGAFFAAQDSDSDGVEGGYYLWTSEEFAGVAGVEAASFFGVTPQGMVDGATVLTAAGDTPPEDARRRLGDHRRQRGAPAVDEQILTSWNGLAIAALAEAGATFGRPDLVDAAREAASFLLDHVATGDGGLLHSYLHSDQGGAAKGDGQAEDYAYLADGLFALWEVTDDGRWFEACERIARRLLADFWDPAEGGLFSTATGAEALVMRRKDIIDGTTPSPNGVASLVFQRLAVVLGDEALAERGREILAVAQPLMQAAPQECGTLFAALDFLYGGAREVVIVGERTRAETQALLTEVWSRFIPNRVLVGISVATPLLEGRGEIDGRPAAYVCERSTCKRPTAEPAELARQLRMGGRPSPETVNRAADLARSTLHRISLLDQLDNPLWIDPLREQGFFRTPPPSIEHYIPGASGSPPWPDSKYLAKMAAVDPFAVHRVAMQIPDTDNSLVHEDLADAALALPPDLSADFAVRAKAWLAASTQPVALPKKLGSLISHLAKAGHGAAALDLAATLLDLRADPTILRGAAAEEGLSLPPQPQARYGPWDYEEILRENMPDVVRATQLPAFDLLADLLARAVELSHPAGTPAGAPADGSYLWRPSIAEDSRNLDRSVRNGLTSALREAGELIVRESPGVLPELIARLETRPWAIFRRIALHLLWMFPQDALALAAQAVADRSLLDDPHTGREYLLVARRQFAALGDDQRRELIASVEAGPDLAAWDATPPRWASDPSDADSAALFAHEWVSERVEYLQDADEDSADVAPFAFEPGQPPMDLATPKQAEWIRSAPLAQLVAFTRAWRPPSTPGAPTRAGFQKKLIEVVTSEPARFAEGAAELAGLDDDTLRAIVAGLREAARQATAFPWQPVIELFATVVARGGDAARSLRIGIARCLAAGFTTGATEIPADQRSAVWAVLRPLAEEPDPAVQLPAAAPADLANVPAVARHTVASEGLQAVARYALWVRRQIEGSPGGRATARAGWEGMPEVRAVLEGHLSRTGDRPVSVQAAFGQWFPWFLMLDPEWAVARRGEIFPEELHLEHLRQASWDTYLAMTPVFDQVYELLADNYRVAVESLAPDGFLTRPQQGLAEHLMALYLRGRIPLEAGSLIGDFFDRAHDYQRAHALAHVGQMLRNLQEGRVPGEVLLRLQRLWERRLAAAQAAPDIEAHAEELATFGTWFASGKFEGTWALPQLAELLSLTGRVAATSKVVEGLKPYMDSMPLEVARCIAALVERERGTMMILGWGKDAQQILSRIVGGTDATARDIALDLLDTFDLQAVQELIRWN